MAASRSAEASLSILRFSQALISLPQYRAATDPGSRTEEGPGEGLTTSVQLLNLTGDEVDDVRADVRHAIADARCLIPGLQADYHILADTLVDGVYGFAAVRWGVAGNMVVAWILTGPITAVLAAILCLLLRLFGF